jgi:hypothetical protein
MAQEKIEDASLAIVSKRSMVNVRGAGPCWATASGIANVGWNGLMPNLLDPLFTRADWQALVPSSITAGTYDSRYFGFYNTGSVQQGFIFDPSDPLGTFTFTDQHATGVFQDPKLDALYMVLAGHIKLWDDNAASPLSYTWKSKIFVPVRPMNPTCARVDAVSYPVTFKLWGDGTLIITQTVASKDAFRLPKGYKAREFEVEIDGTTEVKAVYVAESIEDLKKI